MFRTFKISVVFCVVCFVCVVGVKGEEVTVSGLAGPWAWEDGGLNSDFQYGPAGEGYGAFSPTVVPVIPSTSVTLTYVSGTWSGGG